MACPMPAASSFPHTNSEIEIEMENQLSSPSFPQTNPEIEMEMENQLSSPATTIEATSTSSSTVAGDYRYDVFINHRGPDTKKTFASHLYRRLLLHGFRTFLDQRELQEGLNFPSQIRSAIRSASVHVALFSPRYAESQWCLDELLLMQESGAPIIPVFYHVKPAEIRWTEDQNKNGVYARALHEFQKKTTYDSQTREEKPRYDSATIQKWRNALSTVADTSGFDLEGAFNGDEGQMLDKVVECVVRMAKKTRLYVARYPTGLHDKVKDFETTVLKQQQHTGKVQVVGIVGSGGVGKTTLALEFFNRKCSEYNKSYFLSDVRENAKSSLHLLQSKLLKGLTQLDRHIDNIHQGTEMLREFLSSSQALLILDDIDHKDQVDALLPDRDALCSDSLILITSRDRDVLTRSGVEEPSIYKLTGLPRQHSRELFCSFAFCQAYPLQGFEDLVDKFLMACDGLPLSLKVFGGLLFGKTDKSSWEDTLYRVHEVPNDILERLRISYDALHEEEQQIFLDIACFFIGKKRDMTIRVWDGSGWKGLLGFQNLQSKCLVEVDSHNCIRMHDQLRDMGRKIALDKLPRRLWRPTENIDDLLQQYSVITEVRGIRMFSNTNSGPRDEMLSWYQRRSQELFGNSVMKLCNRLHNARYHYLGIGVMKLQLLQTEGHLLKHILRIVHYPNVIWLSWRDCPYSYLPSWVPVKNLRVLKVQGRVFKTLWQERSQAPFQLRELEISGQLSNISKSIGQLKHLERIDFHHVDLHKLPEEFSHLRSLKALLLRKCPKLKSLPDSFGNLTNLQHIELSECRSLERLPDFFGYLRRLQHIHLSECRRLEMLPDSFGHLRTLQHIKLSMCESLKRLPDSFCNLGNLQHIDLSVCRSLENLPDSFGHLGNLQHIELSGCESLERLPDSFGNLNNLQHIELSGCKRLERLPDSFGNLSNLQHIKLSGCKSLKRLPDAFGNLMELLHTELIWCDNLHRLPDSFGNLRNLQHITLSHCDNLKRLPGSFGKLRNLQRIDLFGCKSLESLPDSFGNLRNLQHIKLRWCENLQRLPDSFGSLMNLQHIELRWCENLRKLPDSFGNLKNLKHIALCWCENLQRLPDSFGNLTYLQHIELICCENLQRLPYSFSNLMNLQHITVSHCNNLRSIPNLARLTKLKLLDVNGCLALEELKGVEHCISLAKLNALHCPNLELGKGLLDRYKSILTLDLLSAKRDQIS